MKYLMAVTGALLLLFVIGHMVGNLQIFAGREAINRYGQLLHASGELLWAVRLGLLAVVVLHLGSAVKLSLDNKAARPVAYAEYKPLGSTYASRTMLMSGLIVLAFIIFHLLHYTVRAQAVNLTGQDFEAFKEALPNGEHRHDVYKMMIVGFRNVWVSAFYALGVGLLCLHLSHGASSLFQSLGWKNDAYRPGLDRLARVLAVVIFLGYISIPVAILLAYGKDL